MRAFIFPFTYKQLPILKFMNVRDYDMIEVHPIVPPAFFKAEMNIGSLDNRYVDKDISILNSVKLINEIDRENDMFYMTSGLGTVDNIKFAIKQAKYLIERGIEVYCTLNTIERNIVKSIDSNFFKSDLLKDINIKYKFTTPEKPIEKLIEPEIPIIGVGSLVGFSNKTEVLLSIYKAIRCRGEKIECITFDQLYSIIGAEVLDISDLLKIDFEQKILSLNWYINQVIKKTECSILLIEIPSGLIKYSNSYLNGAGQFSYLFSQAFSIDYFICCSVLNFNNIDFYLKTQEHLAYKFDYNKVYFHISNVLVDMKTLIQNNMPSICFVSDDYRKKVVDNLNIECKDVGIMNRLFFDLTKEEDIKYFLDSIS